MTCFSCSLFSTDYDRQNRAKGYAHIEFTSTEEAQKVIEHQDQNPFMLQMRRLFVHYAKKGPTSVVGKVTRKFPPSLTLWVANVPHDTTENDLRAVFKPFAEVQSARISMSPFCWVEVS